MKVSWVLLKSLFIWKTLFVSEEKESFLIDSESITFSSWLEKIKLDFVFIEGTYENEMLIIDKLEKLKEYNLFLKYENENYLNEDLNNLNNENPIKSKLYQFIPIYNHIELKEWHYYEFKGFFKNDVFFIKSANLIIETKKIFKWKINNKLNLELKNNEEIELDKLKSLEAYKNKLVEIQISFFSNNKFKINRIRLLQTPFEKVKSLFYKLFIIICFILSLAFIFIDQIVLFYHSFSLSNNSSYLEENKDSSISSILPIKRNCNDLNLTTIYPYLYSSISISKLGDSKYSDFINCNLYENNLNKINFEIDYKEIESIITPDLDEIKLYDYLLKQNKYFKEKHKSLSESNNFLENLTIDCDIENLTNCSQLIGIINNFYPLKEVFFNIKGFDFEKNILKRENNKIYIEELTNETFSLLNYEKIKSIHLENLKEIYNIIQYNTRYDYLKEENRYIVSVWPFYWSRELEYFILNKKINKDSFIVWRYLYLDKNNVKDFILFLSNKKNIINNIKIDWEIKDNVEILNFLTGLENLNKVIINN